MRSASYMVALCLVKKSCRVVDAFSRWEFRRMDPDGRIGQVADGPRLSAHIPLLSSTTRFKSEVVTRGPSKISPAYSSSILPAMASVGSEARSATNLSSSWSTLMVSISAQNICSYGTPGTGGIIKSFSRLGRDQVEVVERGRIGRQNVP
jgi:hypothetical protein